MDKKYDIGLIGLAVMGENLARNIERNGFSVAVYNRTTAKVDEFMGRFAEGKNFGGANSIEEFVKMLNTPRKIIIMVKAGNAVDQTIQALLPHLDEGDILMDCGNSYFQDTRRRSAELMERGLHFLGVGVSGGEEGALNGPSIMPGGSEYAYRGVEEIFTKISAKAGKNEPCCSYIGEDGAGHYVKTVHNGIEYADMQLIAETYHILKRVGLSAEELHEIFTAWNEGELESYLIEITGKIFARKDEDTGLPLVNVILDTAGQKGTGKWTSESSLELGVPTPTITAAVYARFMSAQKDERVKAAEMMSGPVEKYSGDNQQLIAALRDALYAAKISCYAQGFALLKAASVEYNWKIHYGEIAALWRGGCIIRARFLDRITEAYDRDNELPNLMLDPYFLGVLEKNQANLRQVIMTAKELGIPTPALSASLDYYDSYRQAVLPANLIQAQRDYFGAHTYERVDKSGVFHTEWVE